MKNTISESIVDIRKTNEERRPGINLIQDRIKNENPRMSWRKVSELSKIEWTEKNKRTPT
jgi:hypothetical protein